MSEKLKIHWGVRISDDLIGNGLGYRIHSSTLLKYTSKIADITEEAEDAVIIVSPEFYKQRIPDRVNWLFTMFEGTELPKVYADSIQKADYLLAPSTWVKKLLDKYFDPEKVFVISEGVEKDFTFKQRFYPPPGKPFRYLWVGAPNPRKGYEEILVVWQKLFADDLDKELYIKTTNIKGVKKVRNVIRDGRNLPRNELVELYHSAHCFVFPTRGEGFALTLAESMATGLPCISTLYSGLTDFFDFEVGYPIKYKMGVGGMTFMGGRKGERTYLTEVAYPDVCHLASAMCYVRENYKEALELGKKGSERIKKYFTWENSAKTLVDTITEHGGLKKNDIKEKERSLLISVKKPNKKIITMTCWKRFDYTKRVLDGLKVCKGIGDYILMPHVEPGDERVTSLIKNIDFMECDYVLNRLRWDINENTYRALMHGFDNGDFVIHLEDDTVPSPDTLLYFEEMGKKYKKDKEILTICGYNKGELSEGDFHNVYKKPWFTPWGWATWIDRWEEIKLMWHENLKYKYAWGEWMNHQIRGDRYEIRPILGRIQNIGAKDGRFNPSEEYHEEEQFNKVWAGDVEIPEAKFSEVELCLS